MKYIRTKDGIRKYGCNDGIIFATPEEMDYLQKEYKNYIEKSDQSCKIADTIERLVMTGDLLIVEDTTKTYSHSTFPIIYNEKVPFNYNSPIYRIKEFYIKNNGNFIKVAEVKNKGELELL